MDIHLGYKKIGNSLELCLSDVMAYAKSFVFKKNCKDKMKALGIPNKESEEEKIWKKKWCRLGTTDGVYFRYFSSFIGKDLDIVPTNLISNLIEPILNPVKFRPYYSDKNMFDRILGFGCCPDTILRNIDGTYYTKDYKHIDIDNDVLHKLCGLYERILIKPSVDTEGGNGIMIFEKQGGRFISLFSSCLNIEACKIGSNSLSVNMLKKIVGRNFIIQEYAEQSASLSKFNSTSVNTIRVCAYRSVISDEVHILGAVLRIGQKGAYIDNACYGGGYIGINRDGTLCKKVLYKAGESGFILGDIDFRMGYNIPNYDRVISFAKEVCERIPHHRLIALDIMMDKKEYPRLIEFNIQHFSDYFVQTTTSSLFSQWTDEIIDYCIKNRSKRSRILLV